MPYCSHFVVKTNLQQRGIRLLNLGLRGYKISTSRFLTPLFYSRCNSPWCRGGNRDFSLRFESIGSQWMNYTSSIQPNWISALCGSFKTEPQAVIRHTLKQLSIHELSLNWSFLIQQMEVPDLDLRSVSCNLLYSNTKTGTRLRANQVCCMQMC